MLTFLVLGLLLGAVSVVFALQNTSDITVTFITWHVEGSLALILLLSMVSGVLISILVSLPEVFKNYRIKKNLMKDNDALRAELDSHKAMLSRAAEGIPEYPKRPVDDAGRI